MRTATLKITSKVPASFKSQYTGVCLTEDGGIYFGWRGNAKDNLCFTAGNAIQKAIMLMQRHGYDEVTLDIDKEFTEYLQPVKIKLSLC